MSIEDILSKYAGGSEAFSHATILVAKTEQHGAFREPITEGNDAEIFSRLFRIVEKEITSFLYENKLSRLDYSLILMFSLKVLSSKGIRESLGCQPSSQNEVKFEYINDFLSTLNSGDLFRSSFNEILSERNLRWDWEGFAPIKRICAVIPDLKFGRLFTDFSKSSSFEINREFSEPNPLLSVLVAKLSSHVKANTILDPFAGLGNFGIQLLKEFPNSILYLNDINHNITVSGKMNLVLNGIFKFFFTNYNSINENNLLKKADLIVTNPPFGINNKFKADFTLPISSYGNNISKSLTSISILAGLNKLNKKGHMFVLVPDTFLFHYGQKDVRKYLVDKKIIKAIISLPSDMFKPLSRVKMSILYLSKVEHIYPDNVRFISSDSYGAQINSFYINDVIDNFTSQNGENSLNVSYKRIIEGNYEFTESKYTSEKRYGDSYVAIDELSKKEIQGVSLKTKLDIVATGTSVIRIKDVRIAKESARLNVQGVRRYDLTAINKKFQFIPKNAVLIPRFGEEIYPKIFTAEGDYTYDDSALFCIEFDQTRVLPEYIISQFREPEVIQQLNSLRSGAVVPALSLSGLRRLMVSVPSLDVQIDFVKNRQDENLREVISEQEGLEYERFATLKHSMSQPLSVLENDLKSLFEFLEEKDENNSGISMSDYLVPLPDESLASDWENQRLQNSRTRIFNNLRDLKSSFSKIDAMVRATSPLVFEKFSLRSLWDSVLKNNNDGTYRFEIEGDYEASVDKDLLAFSFAYLVENAVKHGFNFSKDPTSNLIVVRIEPSIEANQVVIWYRNNGRPFPTGFNLEHIFEKGRTSDKRSGSGFGGFMIHQIIQKHSGSITPFSLEQNQFPVQFQITIPIDHE